MTSTYLLARILCLLGTVAAARGAVLFQDNFDTPGTTLNTSVWTTEFGAASFLGRTQLINWVSGGGQFVVSGGMAQLTLQTFNPTGFSFYAPHSKTLQSFQPSASTTIEMTARLQINSLQPGLVYGIYFYGCPGSCATQHDEIDIELLTNELQPGGPYRVQLNRYANEPLGGGHGGLVNLPGGFDPLAAHDWTIRWSLGRIDYLVDGALLGSATDFVPQGPMHVNQIVWGPDGNWPAAFSAALQPTGNPANNQSFGALMDSITVSESAVPEPGTTALLAAGALAMIARKRFIAPAAAPTRPAGLPDRS